MYKDGRAIGVGIFWSAGYTKAYHTLDGVKLDSTSLAEAEKLAKDKFDLPAPSLKPQLGIASRYFSQKRVGPDGERLYKDSGDWGTFIGELNASGERHGQGTMIYESGSVYEGAFANDKYSGKGVFSYSNGDKHEGEWKEGEPNGKGIFCTADGSVEYSIYEVGSKVGEGVMWSADRKTAHKMVDGKTKCEISLAVAQQVAKDRFDLPIPEPFTTTTAPTAPKPASIEKLGYFRSLFADKKVGPDGKLMFKDYGEWGSYEGNVDEAGNRQGEGKMTWKSGNSYKGPFVDNKFHGEKGVYQWVDGDIYDGAWKNGERHGKGIFKNADGTVEFLNYDNGEGKGEGLVWSADRKTVHKLLDGHKQSEMSLTMAAKLAKEKFGFAVPEAPKFVAPTGFFGSLFASRKAGPDGKILFKDNGDWGSFDGDVDSAGNRQGKGKMTYQGGDSYEGGFVDNKFECDKGVYRWADGDEYVGAWKAGQHHGRGRFTKADGTVDYSEYENGTEKGEGVSLSADRKTARKLVDGKKTLELLVEEAMSIIRGKWSFCDQ